MIFAHGQKGEKMSDLISRQAAIDELKKTVAVNKNPNHDARIWEEGMNCAITIIGALPSAQPDIIACGDCKHWICHDRRCGYWNHGVKPLDWCCHAEQR